MWETLCVLSLLCPSLAFSGDLAHGEIKAKARSGVSHDELMWGWAGGVGGESRSDFVVPTFEMGMLVPPCFLVPVG